MFFRGTEFFQTGIQIFQTVVQFPGGKVLFRFRNILPRGTVSDHSQIEIGICPDIRCVSGGGDRLGITCGGIVIFSVILQTESVMIDGFGGHFCRFGSGFRRRHLIRHLIRHFF